MVVSPLPGGVLGRRQRAGWAGTCAAAPGALLGLHGGRERAVDEEGRRVPTGTGVPRGGEEPARSVGCRRESPPSD